MMPRPAFPPVARGLGSLVWVAALIGLTACTPTPTGPTVLWITASELPQVPEGMAVARGGQGLLADLASALIGEEVTPLAGEPRDVIVPPKADTLCEVVARYGLETAAYLTEPGLREEFGFLQGALHSSDLPMLMAESPEGPLRGAVSAAYGFLEQKVPRPMEDGALVWLHLNLALIPDETARADFLSTTVAHFESLLKRRPDSALVLVGFGAPGEAGSVSVRSPWSDGPAEPIRATDLFEVVLDGMGHELDGNRTRRVGEIHEILLPEQPAETPKDR